MKHSSCDLGAMSKYESEKKRSLDPKVENQKLITFLISRPWGSPEKANGDLHFTEDFDFKLMDSKVWISKVTNFLLESGAIFM